MSSSVQLSVSVSSSINPSHSISVSNSCYNMPSNIRLINPSQLEEVPDNISELEVYNEEEDEVIDFAASRAARNQLLHKSTTKGPSRSQEIFPKIDNNVLDNLDNKTEFDFIDDDDICILSQQLARQKLLDSGNANITNNVENELSSDIPRDDIDVQASKEARAALLSDSSDHTKAPIGSLQSGNNFKTIKPDLIAKPNQDLSDLIDDLYDMDSGSRRKKPTINVAGTLTSNKSMSVYSTDVLNQEMNTARQNSSEFSPYSDNSNFSGISSSPDNRLLESPSPPNSFPLASSILTTEEIDSFLDTTQEPVISCSSASSYVVVTSSAYSTYPQVSVIATVPNVALPMLVTAPFQQNQAMTYVPVFVPSNSYNSSNFITPLTPPVTPPLQQSVSSLISTPVTTTVLPQQRRPVGRPPSKKNYKSTPSSIKPKPEFFNNADPEAYRMAVSMPEDKIHEIDSFGNSYLHLLAQDRNVTINQFSPFYYRLKRSTTTLIDYLNSINRVGDSPLTLFIRRGYLDGVRFCLEFWAQTIFIGNPKERFHPLHLSAVLQCPIPGDTNPNNDIFMLILNKTAQKEPPCGGAKQLSTYLNRIAHEKRSESSNTLTDAFLNLRVLEILVRQDGNDSLYGRVYNATERIKAVIQYGANVNEPMLTEPCHTCLTWVAANAKRPSYLLELMMTESLKNNMCDVGYVEAIKAYYKSNPNETFDQKQMFINWIDDKFCPQTDILQDFNLSDISDLFV